MMTICIAAICDDGKGCVVAADREITAAGLSLEFEHGESKIDRLTTSSVVMSSGDALLAAQIIARTRDTLSPDQDYAVLAMAERLRDTFMAVHLERAEAVLLRPRGFTWTEFKEKGAQQLPLQVYQEITNAIFNFGLNVVEFLVAGIDTTGAHIFRVYYSGIIGGNWIEWCDKLGHREIGSGALHAAILMSLEGQFSRLPVADCVYNVYSAKKSAELAPGVGPATDLAIIDANGIIAADSSLLGELEQLRLKSKSGRPASSDIDALLASLRSKR